MQADRLSVPSSRWLSHSSRPHVLWRGILALVVGGPGCEACGFVAHLRVFVDSALYRPTTAALAGAAQRKVCDKGGGADESVAALPIGRLPIGGMRYTAVFRSLVGGQTVN